MKKSLYFIFLILISVFGCQQSPENFNRIISQFEKVSIEGFEGYGIYQRGTDKESNRMIYVSKTLDTDTFRNSGNVVVAIDSTGQVQYTESKNTNFNLNIDSVKQIALLFNSLDINGLTIDYEGKAVIFLYSLEIPQLMYSPTNAEYEGWKRIKNSWYRRGR
jgi:hypothetical protein